MSRNHHTETKKCQCYNCGKVTQRVYNFSLGKWARAFKCKCGSESFRWYNC
jgi:lysyl-tRNA synthetase class I